MNKSEAEVETKIPSSDMLLASETTTGSKTMQPADIKETAHQLIDQLPEGSTWSDAIYEMVVRREIEIGLEDSEAGRTTSVESIRKEYGFD
jgi:hypothetical protein